MNWALMFGNGEFMLSAGGKPSTEERREVDLYVSTDRVEDLYRQLKDRVEVRETLHDTFYGMREFIIRDINGFWITFGQEAAQTFDKPQRGATLGIAISSPTLMASPPSCRGDANNGCSQQTRRRSSLK